MDKRADIRNRVPQGPHRGAFLSGWTDAVNGNRYGSIDKKKTHQNMGNLFGWIFGDKPEEFRRQIWELYQAEAIDIQEE